MWGCLMRLPACAWDLLQGWFWFGQLAVCCVQMGRTPCSMQCFNTTTVSLCSWGARHMHHALHCRFKGTILQSWRVSLWLRGT